MFTRRLEHRLSRRIVIETLFRSIDGMQLRSLERVCAAQSMKKIGFDWPIENQSKPTLTAL